MPANASNRRRAGTVLWSCLLVLSALACSADRPAAKRTTKQTMALPTGVTLAYLDLGAADGTPVFLLHGYTDTSRSFLPTIERLAELRPDLRLIAPDLRGHGDSSLPDAARCAEAPERCFGVPDFAADLLALVDALGIERAHWVGHSLGSLIAQEIALEHPERVDRQVWISTTGATLDNPVLRDFLLEGTFRGPWRAAAESQGRRWPDDVYVLTALDLDPDAEQWMVENWVTEPLAAPALLTAIAPETARVPVGTWLGLNRSLLGLDHRERLAGVAAPTLVLWATQDPMFLEEPDQSELRSVLERAASHCGGPFYWKQYGRRPLPESGLPDGELAHNFHWAVPDQVAAELASFLRAGGRPTEEHPYADPAQPGRVVIEPPPTATWSALPSDCSS